MLYDIFDSVAIGMLHNFTTNISVAGLPLLCVALRDSSLDCEKQIFEK